MSNRASLSQAVATFVGDNIESLPQLDVFALLMETPQRWWDAATAAEALTMDQATARRALERLASRNLLEITVTSEVRYRYQPGTPDLRAASREFAGAYRTSAVAIIRLVTKNQRPAIQDFADAFKVRRHGDR